MGGEAEANPRPRVRFGARSPIPTRRPARPIPTPGHPPLSNAATAAVEWLVLGGLDVALDDATVGRVPTRLLRRSGARPALSGPQLVLGPEMATSGRAW